MMDPIPKIFVEDDFVIDTLLYDSLYMNDSIYDFNNEIFYDE